MSDAAYDPETLLVGTIGRPHGLKGETVLRPHNPAGSDLARVKELILERANGERERRTVESIRRVETGWLLRLVGISSRDAADTLTNLAVRVSRRVLPPPRPGEFFVEDTVGCDVLAEDGTRLGSVASLFWNGAQDVWIVREGDREMLIPVVPAFVREVDAAARRIVVTWTPDLDGEDTEGEPR